MFDKKPDPQEEQKPQDEWSKLFPELKGEDIRQDIRVNLVRLRNRGRISVGVDLEQLEDFLVWLWQFNKETPVRYTGMSPYSYFLHLLANNVA